MHEASIAQGIIDIVRQNTEGCEPGAVRCVHVTVGECSGVLADSLKFCFEALTAETDLAHVRLDIEEVPFHITCHACGRTAHNPNGFMICPHCGATDTVIVSGSEMRVTEIEVDAEAPV